MKGKGNKIFGWPSAFTHYTMRDVFNDSIIPIIIALFITVIIFMGGKDIIITIEKVSGLGLNITPAMVALILAAYTILITMYWAPICDKIKLDKKAGLPLLKGLNASFAVTIRIATIGIVFLLATNSIGTISIPISENIANYFNICILFLIFYFIVFPIYMLIDIAINIYNIAIFSIEIKNE